MANCKSREAMVKEITAEAIKDLKANNKDISAKEIRAKAVEVANLIMDKAQVLAEQDVKATERKILGSTPTAKSIYEALTDAEVDEQYIDTDGSIDKARNVNDALKELDKKVQGDSFDAEWSELLDSHMENIIKAIGNFNDSDIRIRAAKTGNEVGGTYEPFINRMNLSVATPTLGKSYRNRFAMTNQELLAHESVHAAVNFLFDPNVTLDTDTKLLVNSVKKLYKLAGSQSKWQDLLPGYEDNSGQYTDFEISEAKKKFDYIFDNPKGNGFEEFMTHLLTNKQFAEAMNNVSALDKTLVAKDEHFLDTVVRLFKNFLEKLVGIATNTKDNSITVEGERFILNIIKAQEVGRDRVIVEQAVKLAENSAERVNEVLGKADEKLKPFVEDAIETLSGNPTRSREEKLKDMTKEERIEAYNELSKKIRKSFENVDVKKDLPTYLKPIRTMVNLIKLAKALPAMREAKILLPDEFAKLNNIMMNRLGVIEEGFLRTVINDFLDKDDLQNFIADSILVLTSAVDGLRERTYEEVLDQNKEWFGNIKIDERENLRYNEALNDVILRTDIQSLGLNAKGLVELLRDPEKVSKEIIKLRAGLDKEQLDDVAKLAEELTNGTGFISNAHNIANKFGHDKPKQATQKEIDQIDKLVTLEALALTKKENKQALLDFVEGKGYEDYNERIQSKVSVKTGLSTEGVITKEGYIEQAMTGLDNFMQYAHGMQVSAKEEMGDNQYQYVKGYIRETYDKNVALEYHPMSMKRELEDKGYVFHRKLGKVPGSTKAYGVFTIRDANVTRANGALGLQGVRARGFTLLDKINEESNESPADSQLDPQTKAAQFRKILKQTIKQYRAGKLRSDMHPIYNDSGRIVNFRVTMNHQEKKELLNMETRGTFNMARTFSTRGTAKITEEHNLEVLKRLQLDYETNYKGNEDKYVTIKGSVLDASAYGLESIDTKHLGKYEEMWAKLPKSTKANARKLFNDDKIVIRKDLLKNAFGENDITITDFKLADKWSDKTRAKARVMEKWWMDAMNIAKGNIVIKTGDVFIGNVISNMKVLVYVGVNPVKGLKLITLGARELKRYEDNRKELNTLKRDKLAGKKVSNNKIAELEAELKNNSVDPLIEAGLYQSVVEDVSTKEELNRITNYFDDKSGKYIKNETASAVIQNMFMTQKTKPYQILLKSTQVSDFYFRYAQYYDALDKGTNEKQALRDITDNYINYETPLEKHVRYMDKMGPLFFVQYWVKIQRVIKKLIQANPGRIAADIGTQQFITGDTADILDASIPDAYYNPFKLFSNIFEFLTPSGAEMVARFI